MAKKRLTLEEIRNLPDDYVGSPDFKDDPEFVPKTQPSYKDRVVYNTKSRFHARRYLKLLHFTHSSTKAAFIMLLAAVAALVVANTGAHEPFLEFWETEFGVFFGHNEVGLSLAEIINDIFMAIFFLLVGIEIKYEMTVGELTNIRQALLPIIAACGGVIAPLVIYCAFNATNPETIHGFGIPTATDIAFALGVMALLGNRIPNGVRVFLSTLAVADDIIAILIIAIFYGQTPDIMWLGVAAVIVVVLIIMNRTGVYSIAAYLLVGVFLWFAVFQSGVHSTIAGVLLAFTIPTGSRVNLKMFGTWAADKVDQANSMVDLDQPIMGQDMYMRTVSTLGTVAKQAIPPATRLEHKLYPWVYFGILPLFALTNADVSLVGTDIGTLFTSPVFFGVFFGLLVGKPLGIMLASFIVVKTKIASLPENVNWIHMLGAAILGGLGFTMAIFVANLAFEDAALITVAKAGILAATTLAGIIGFSFLYVQARVAQKKGISYIPVTPEGVDLQTAGIEADEDAFESLDAANSALIELQIEAARQAGETEVAIQTDIMPDEDKNVV